MNNVSEVKSHETSDGRRLLFLTKYARNGASSRYRSYQYLPYFENAGFDCTVSPLFDNDYLEYKYRLGKARLSDVMKAFMRRCKALLNAGRYDLVVIEKEVLPYFPALPERWLNRRRIPYVVDYDDALFHQYDSNSRTWVRQLLGKKIARVMNGARLVTAGNRYLADYARSSGAEYVATVPTVIDLERYPEQLVGNQENSVFTVGWIGSPATAKYVEEIGPALAAFCADGKGRVRLIGSGKVDLPDVPYEVIPWVEGDEVAQLQQLDAGIMPLLDSPWERGKCGFKLIQYMACGLPVVASPVGVNTEIVVDGENGFLASNQEEWIRALNRLRNDRELRRSMGAAGRDVVEERFSLQVTAPRLECLMHDIFETDRTDA